MLPVGFPVFYANGGLSWGALTLVLLLSGAGTCQEPGRITFSIDVQGPTVGAFTPGESGSTDSFYRRKIGGADILTVGTDIASTLPPEPNAPYRGPLPDPPVPGTVAFGVDPGVQDARTLGLLPTVIGEAELDAFSFGNDVGSAFLFAVDEFSEGRRGAVVEQVSLGEAAGDVFRYLGGAQHDHAIDGHGGESPNVPLGLGLQEPNSPNPELPDFGDNLDAFDFNTTAADLAGSIYFSLDGDFDDPLERLSFPEGPNLGTAQRNSVSPADILVVTDPTVGSPDVYLSASDLGLNAAGDDIDALVLFDAQRDNIFDPNEDRVFFSVRRGSAIVEDDVVDSELAIPIRPGDILIPSLDPGETPAIFVRAEDLGLAANRASGEAAAAFGFGSPSAADDVVGLDRIAQDGDMNCNSVLDPDDATAFVFALTDAEAYSNDLSLCGLPPASHGDLSLDGRFGFDDIEAFVAIMTASGAMGEEQVQQLLAGVPEPSSAFLCFLGALLVFSRWRTRTRY